MRRNQLITTAALVAACAAPTTAVAQSQDLRSPDTRDAAAAAEARNYQDLRSPDTTDAAAHRGLYEADRGPYVLNRHYGSPDAADAARDLPPVQIPSPVVEVRNPSSGFDWGDAGIGAAGMFALFAIGTGLTMGVAQARRRRDPQALAQ
jgi:hypothetical protein